MKPSTPDRPPMWSTPEKRAENSRRPWTLRSKLMTAAVVVGMISFYLGRYEANQRTALIEKYNQENPALISPAKAPPPVPTYNPADLVRRTQSAPYPIR